MTRTRLTLLAAVLCTAATAHAADPASAPSRYGTPDKLTHVCDSCGIVESVKAETRKGKGSGVGVVGGAVVGGLLGHQLGGGMGKTLITAGGAVAGGVAGNEVERRVKKHTVWIMRVTGRDGVTKTYEQGSQPAFKAGDTVRIDGQALSKY